MKKITYIVLSVVFVAMILVLSKSFIDLKSVDKLKKIEGGDYSYIDDEYVRKHLEILFPKGVDTKDSNYMWVHKDINGDGEEDLILQ